PTAPIGKLYKRFRKRIATTNKAIKEGEKLRRIVLFNGKIVDLRTPAVGTQDLGYQDLEDEEVLYTDWAAVHTRMEDWAYDGDDDWYGGIIAGTFLFDYEKALRRNSNISKILNIDKLEENGIHIPYDSFRVTEASVTRAGDSSLVDVVDCSITSLEDEDKDYPTTGTVEWHDWGIEMGYEDYQMMVINAPAEGEPWASALYCTEYASTPTSRLIVRNIVNPVASGPWSGTSLNTTGDTPYRLVGFEVIDYVTEYGEQIIAGDFDGDMYNEYLTRVTIKDSTATLIEVIITEVNDYVSALQEYYDLCVQECAINETSETFNTFFSEGILAAYEDDMENAPWVATPVAYVYFMDVATDLYAGDSDAMATAAAEIIQQINPVNGTLEAIESFLEFFNGFSETYLDISTLTTALDDDYSEKTYEVNLTIPHPNYLTSFDSSCADECDDATDCDGYPLASCIGGKCVAEEEEEEAEVTEKWDSWDSLQINKGSKKWDDASTTLLTEWFNVECGWWIPEYISVDTTDRQNQDYLSFLGILAEIEGMYERPTSTTSDWPWEGSSITPELEGWDLTARTGAGAMFFRRKLNSDGSEVDEAFHFWFDTASDSDYKCEFHAQRWKWYVVTEVDGTIISDEYGTSDYTGANEVTLCADEYLGCVERYGYSNESLMVCWVAEELYGKDDYRTHLARLYANTHDSWFLRAYQKYGVEWANWLKRHTWAKPLVRPIWDRMARLGKEIIVDSPNALGGK
ncbi:hypothetical protein CMI47_21305, partial [Candidatus Pacearchaeota archaeon]|nr:hypothetical protein [Candidatus Pacearchaeota archaeon]